MHPEDNPTLAMDLLRETRRHVADALNALGKRTRAELRAEPAVQDAVMRSVRLFVETRHRIATYYHGTSTKRRREKFTDIGEDLFTDSQPPSVKKLYNFVHHELPQELERLDFILQKSQEYQTIVNANPPFSENTLSVPTPIQIETANAPYASAMENYDPRAMEISVAEMTAKMSGKPIDPAQLLIYKAVQSSDPQTRIRGAQQALKISPDCADAYVILAEETAKSVQDAAELYRKGMAAGERALGATAFQEYAGKFWGVLETRGYMRARIGLARCLNNLGKKEEAVSHWQAMLELNPNDNQGVRDELMQCLLVLGKEAQARQLYEKYEEDPKAVWAWSRALLDFRKYDNSQPANESLQAAIKTNRHVAPLLLCGQRIRHQELPNYSGFGDKNEAIVYAFDAWDAWQATPGALAWLKSQTQ